MKEFNGRIIDKNMGDECTERIVIFAKNKNYTRAFANLVDGLKYSGRRALYTMFQLEMEDGRVPHKLLYITGMCQAKYHHHAPISDTLINMAQPWTTNVPFIIPEGIFGTISGGSFCSSSLNCRE